MNHKIECPNCQGSNDFVIDRIEGFDEIVCNYCGSTLFFSWLIPLGEEIVLHKKGKYKRNDKG